MCSANQSSPIRKIIKQIRPHRSLKNLTDVAFAADDEKGDEENRSQSNISAHFISSLRFIRMT
jgi:hypothetical protein